MFPPAKIGDKVNDILTPALVLDLDNFEHNLRHVHEQLEPLLELGILFLDRKFKIKMMRIPTNLTNSIQSLNPITA